MTQKINYHGGMALVWWQVPSSQGELSQIWVSSSFSKKTKIKRKKERMGAAHHLSWSPQKWELCALLDLLLLLLLFFSWIRCYSFCQTMNCAILPQNQLIMKKTLKFFMAFDITLRWPVFKVIVGSQIVVSPTVFKAYHIYPK